MGYGTRSDTGHHLRIPKVLHDESRHLHLDQVAHIGIRQRHAQVGINRRIPTRGPGERAVGLQFDGVDLQQLLSKQGV